MAGEKVNAALKRIARAIAKNQTTFKEIDQENLQVTQGDRSVIIKINQFHTSESDTDYR